MMRALKQLWHGQKPVLIAFILALSLTGYFGTRFIASSIYWADPAHHDVQIQGWMTPGYVARSYRVSPRIVEAALGLANGEGRGMTIAEIADVQGKSLAIMGADILAAAHAIRALNSGGSPR